MYKRILLVNNRLEWDFVGVLHEYINCINKKNVSNCFIDGNYYIDSGIEFSEVHNCLNSTME